MVIGKSKAISDICLMCRNLEKSIDFYQQSLGFTLRRRAEGFADFETQGVVLALWDINHFCEHVGYNTQDTAPGSHKVMNAIELSSCEELDQLYCELTERAVTFIKAPKSYPWNAYCAYFNDPDNNLWELYCWMGDPNDYHTS